MRQVQATSASMVRWGMMEQLAISKLARVQRQARTSITQSCLFTSARHSREGGKPSSDTYGQSLWIPAFAGMTGLLTVSRLARVPRQTCTSITQSCLFTSARHSREGGKPSSDTYGQSLWIPAFAGMTGALTVSRLGHIQRETRTSTSQSCLFTSARHSREGGKPSSDTCGQSLWIPALAGMTGLLTVSRLARVPRQTCTSITQSCLFTSARHSREGGNLSSDTYGQSLWILAFAGMTGLLTVSRLARVPRQACTSITQSCLFTLARHSREGGNLSSDTCGLSLWIPAFAGMTGVLAVSRLFHIQREAQTSIAHLRTFVS